MEEKFEEKIEKEFKETIEQLKKEDTDTEKEFIKTIEQLKKEDMNTEKVKKYILIVKRYLDRLVQGCEGELTKEECLADYLEEYEKELEVSDEYIDDVALRFAQYKAYNVLLETAKSSKSNFKRLVNQARSVKPTIGKDRNTVSEQELVKLLRSIIVAFPRLGENELLGIIQNKQKHTVNILKGRLIKSIQSHVVYLNEYGLLDEYIDEANEELKQLGLESVTLRKRNPLPDEIIDGKGNIMRYDENGNLRKYDENGIVIEDDEDIEYFEEDIGVLDSLDEEYLQKKSPEDLLLMDTTWKAQYFEERLQVSKAMSVIKFLDLWPTLLNEGEDAIQNIDDKTISNALRRDLALTYLWRNNSNITPKMKTQYTNFYKSMGMEKQLRLEDEISGQDKELNNLVGTSNHIVLEQCLIINRLKAKEFNDVKNWGIIGYREEDEQKESDIADGGRVVLIAVENHNLKGISIISVPEKFLIRFFEKDPKLPKFKKINNIDEDYMKLMYKLPTSQYYKKQVNKKYEQNPHSPIYASLAGKKAKKPVDNTECEL